MILKNKNIAGDGVKILSIDELGKDADEITNRLMELSKNKIILMVGEDQWIKPECLLSFLNDFVALKFVERRKRIKHNQKEGIKRALERKKAGIGTYGRPGVKLPHDFEERIIGIMEHGGNLQEYQKNLDMAKSTFYKYSGRVIAKYEAKRFSSDGEKK